MKNIFALTAISLGLVACGGGGGAGASTTSVVNYCDINQQTISKINVQPYYTFQGLVSSWANDTSVVGKMEGEWFTNAITHAASVSYKTGDVELKRNIVNSLYTWAVANAWQGTKKCYVVSAPFNGGTSSWDPTCTQWTVADGSDLSAIQDFNYVMMNVASIRHGYSLISNWSSVAEPAKHLRIKQWLDYWKDYTPPASGVFFGMGMGYFQYQIQIAEDDGNTTRARELATQMITGIVPLVNADGSITNRTNRGNRALWYHFASLNEILTSVYLAKKYNVTIPVELERNLHTAVTLFLDTLDNPSTILPWASAGYNNGGDGRNQNFQFADWYNSTYGASWIYLYDKWYPTHQNTVRLRAKVPYGDTKSEAIDTQYGEGLGCTIS